MKKSFKTVRYDIATDKVKGHVKAVFLTDLHSRYYGEFQEELIHAIEEQKPDYIFIGGDMMVTKPYAEMDMKPLEYILQAFSGIVPIYYCYGNHEERMRKRRWRYPGCYEQFCEMQKKYGVKNMVNRTVLLDCNISLSGLLVPQYFYDKRISFNSYEKGWIGKSVPEMNGDHYQILLAHTPMCMEQYWEAGADLVLCGHYHGGVMRLPGNRGLISPQFMPFTARSWGMYHKKGDMDKIGITGSGLGTHSVNIRIFNPAELVVIEWNG